MSSGGAAGRSSDDGPTASLPPPGRPSPHGPDQGGASGHGASGHGAAGHGPAGGGRRRPVPADLLTIGEVLAELQGEFPDVSHSKIRFLEDRGLVTPARTPSGYRKFSRRDVARLQLVLSLQRDHYLPLKVIGEHVAALDAGHAPPRLPGAGYREDLAGEAADAPGVGAPAPDDGRGASPQGAERPRVAATTSRPVPQGRLSRADVVARAGGDAALVDGLESHGLLPRAGSAGYPAECADVVAAAKVLGAFGIEPRHLRVLRTAAEREATLVEQVVTPLRRTQRSPGGTAGGAAVPGRAAEVTAELASTLLRLHGSLLRLALDAADG